MARLSIRTTYYDDSNEGCNHRSFLLCSVSRFRATSDCMSSFENLTSENIRAQAPRGILVLPVGSVEQHGPHLPLTVDMAIPSRIAARLVDKIQGFIAPAISY